LWDDAGGNQGVLTFLACLLRQLFSALGMLSCENAPYWKTVVSLLILQQMFSDDTRTKLENIIRGALLESEEGAGTAVRNFLCRRFKTGAKVKEDFEGQSILKKEQAGLLIEYARQNNLLLSSIPEQAVFLTQGGEAKVYLTEDGLSVIKVNGAAYYATWLDYFNSLMIHNLIFPETAYEFLGFKYEDSQLVAVVKQVFVTTDTTADLEAVITVLAFNGFSNIKRHDFYNQELGLLLEDMHDENVIAKADALLFIDTVFYIAGTNFKY